MNCYKRPLVSVCSMGFRIDIDVLKDIGYIAYSALSYPVRVQAYPIVLVALKKVKS